MSGFLDFITPGVGSAISGIASLAGGLFNNNASAKAAQQSARNNYLLMLQDEAYGRESAATANAFSRDMQLESERFNDVEVEKAMQFSSQQAATQRDFEAQMSNTAMRRSVADMRAAGLNPILGIAQGGASTPTVSAPTGQAATVGIPGASTAHAAMAQTQPARTQDFITPAVATAMQTYRALNDAQQTQATVGNINADTQVKATAAQLNQSSAARQDADKALAIATTDLKPSERARIEQDTQTSASQSQANRAQAALAAHLASQADAQAGNLQSQKRNTDILNDYLQRNRDYYPGMDTSVSLPGGIRVPAQYLLGTLKNLMPQSAGGLDTSAFRAPITIPAPSGVNPGASGSVFTGQ